MGLRDLTPYPPLRRMASLSLQTGTKEVLTSISFLGLSRSSLKTQPRNIKCIARLRRLFFRTT
jgi:hypothetical protein